MLLNIRQQMDDAKCYEVVRELRWPDGAISILQSITVKVNMLVTTTAMASMRYMSTL